MYKAISYYEKASSDYKLEHTDNSKIYDDEQGYATVNTIYLYKVLLDALDDSLDTETKQNYKDKIEELRDETLEHIEKYKELFSSNKYLNPTIAELYFKKLSYDEAKEYLDKSHVKNEEEQRLDSLEKSTYISDEIKVFIQKSRDKKIAISRAKLTTIGQFTALYKLDNKDKSPDEAIAFLENKFRKFVSDKDEDTKDESKRIVLKNIITSFYYEKIGLALSGGGFRASLFHIGVFSRLAELDMLKHIDVISSVSGGSIIAMHYYLKLQQLLETKDNNEINQEDYIELVKDMQTEFLDGVKTNIRMQAFEKFNSCSESVTQRIGKLYQTELFNKAVNGCAHRRMNKLFIHPKVDNKKLKSFNPHFNNFEIENKVPILVINSTCLNNGHNWRFTASGMGESQYMYDTTIDKNTVHKYARYEKFSKEFKNFTIADAVASSSCVPGLFDPIELNGAYQKDENIKLVDGGVYDNQGLASLLDEECKLIICSDASGQFNDENDPSSCRLSVIPRINDALMDRGRDQEYEIVKEMLADKKIDGLCILHLKQCFEPKETLEEKRKVTPHGKCADADIYKDIDIEIQECLSKVRTDLDSFNDMEAYSLMYSGYIIMSKWFEALKKEQSIWKKFETDKDIEKDEDRWSFLKIKNVMDKDKNRLIEQLKDSQKLFFKISIFEVKSVKISVALIILIIYTLALFYIPLWMTLSTIALVIAVSLAINKIHGVIKQITKPIFWIIAKFNLKYLNEKYLQEGSVK